MMKKNRIILTALFVLILMGCENSIEKNDNELTKHLSALVPSSLLSDVSAGLVYRVSESYYDPSINGPSSYTNALQGIFTENLQTVDITKVSIFNMNLYRPEESIDGIYIGVISEDNFAPSSGSVNWDIEGYLGTSGVVNQPIANKLAFVTPLPYEAVSIYNDVIINYTGVGTTNIHVEFYVDKLINELNDIDTSGDPNVDPLEFEIANTGQVIITPTMMTNLIPNRYYRIKLSHKVISEAIYNNEKVSLYSDHIINTIVKLNN